MKKGITRTAAVASGVVEAWRNVGARFERFCVTAGIAALTDMMERDAAELCGRRYGREDGRCGHRWGQTAGKLGFHGGKIAIERPRVRRRDGHELVLPSWEAAHAEDWLGRWAMNLMLINVSTRRFGRAVRLPEGDIPGALGPLAYLRDGSGIGPFVPRAGYRKTPPADGVQAGHAAAKTWRRLKGENQLLKVIQ